MIGISTAGIQAPIVNFETTTTSSTMKVATEPTALMIWFRRQPFSCTLRWWITMPACDSVKPVNTPDGVERDQRAGVAAERDDQPGRDEAEHDDAVREHEPVAAVGQLARQVAVTRDDRRNPWEVGEGGVGGQDQDGEGRELEDVVERRGAPVDVARHERQQRLVVLRRWFEHGRLQVRGEHRDPHEEHAEDEAHGDQGAGGVLRLGLLERGNAVRDGLDTGQRNRTGRERSEQDEHADAGEDRQTVTAERRAVFVRELGERLCRSRAWRRARRR